MEAGLYLVTEGSRILPSWGYPCRYVASDVSYDRVKRDGENPMEEHAFKGMEQLLTVLKGK